MIVRVLGSAAGGGVPQWNCACANCAAARAGRAPRRSQSSFAVSGDARCWWLVNCSPDIAQQIEAAPALQPRNARGTPIAGMLFTDANVDHLGGLAVLRQSGTHAFRLFSSAVVRDLATAQRAFAPFAEPPHAWQSVAPEEPVALDGGLVASAVAIGGATPGYDGRRAHPHAVVAFEITDPLTGGRALFAPVFDGVGAPLLDAARRADVAFFDGSFFSDDELGEVAVEKSARSLGHLPVGGDAGSLATLRTLPPRGRRFLAHLNNTNPLLDPHSYAHECVANAGFEICEDGMELTL